MNTAFLIICTVLAGITSLACTTLAEIVTIKQKYAVASPYQRFVASFQEPSGTNFPHLTLAVASMLLFVGWVLAPVYGRKVTLTQRIHDGLKIHVLGKFAALIGYGLCLLALTFAGQAEESLKEYVSNETVSQAEAWLKKYTSGGRKNRTGQD